MAKRVGLALLLLLIGFLSFNFEALIYGIQQGQGQFKILWNAKPIDDLMKQTAFPDSTKQKFKFIRAIKQFAADSLGLNATANYETFYDQQGQPILWVLTASPEFEIKAYEWCFPIAGCFPYKGSFDYQKVKKFEEEMIQKGYDTELDEVSAWSTLGWFSDPILSSMLLRSKGSLADLIIHESVHATLYVKDSVQFNENLASFIGKKGAEKFLASYFGEESKQLEEFGSEQERGVLFRKFMSTEIAKLDSLYSKMDTSIELHIKRKLKSQWIDDLKMRLLHSAYYEDTISAKERLKDFNPNNAYFSKLSTYTKEFPSLEKQYKTNFKGNLKKMIRSFEKKYESL